MGVEPSKIGDKARVFGEWRYRCYSFFAVSFPFFFLREISFQEQNLAGNEIDESKNSELSSLRKNLIPRFLSGNEKRASEMSSLRQLSNDKRLETVYASRCNSALFMQRLRDSIFRAINQIPQNPFFFFVIAVRRLFD